jgi:two-component system response regulator YesN
LKEYIHAHFKEDIKLEDYAQLVYLSPKYLSELFKKETGSNITEYVIHYRIKIAKELLNDVQYKVNEVAEMVGYSDTKYFGKLFKKIVGVNPSEYKKVLQ